MAAPTELLTYGTLASPVLVRERVRRGLNEIDRVELVYHATSSSAFEIGDTPSGYSGLRVQDYDRETLPGRYEYRLNCEGLISGTNKRIALRWKENSMSWDEADDTRIVVASTGWNPGSTLPGFGNMRLMEVDDEALLDGRWSRRVYHYRGIRNQGLIERRVTCNGNIVQPGQPVIVNLTGGWLDYRDANVSLPRIVCVERLKLTSRPNTALIPRGNMTVPVSGHAFPPVQIISVSGEIKYNFPWGWTVASIDYDQLASNIPLYIGTFTYEYVPEAQF